MKIVIVGSGFGAVKLAAELSKCQVGSITLVSDNHRLTTAEMIRAVATGGNFEQMAVPIVDILKHYPRVKLVHDSLVEIDAKTKRIICEKTTRKYDALVLAMEQVSQFSGTNPRKQRSYAASSLESAKLFQVDFHEMLIENDRKKMHCAIVGGGKTGVDLAGALVEYSSKIEQAHQLKTNLCEISLIEASSRILPGESVSAQRKIKYQLNRNKIKFHLRTDVNKFGRDKLVLSNKAVAVDITIRTDALTVHPIFKKHPTLFKMDKMGKVVVNHYLSAYPNIYVIGASAQANDSDDVTVAMHDAGFLAKHLSRIYNGKVLKSYVEPRDLLFSVRLCRFWAYVEYGGVYIAGRSGAMVESLAELNRYCQLMPYRQAVRYWRNFRKNATTCQLCTGS